MSKYEKKPFPWRCSNCWEQAVHGAIVDCTRQMYHDGCEYTVHVPDLKTPKCAKCGRVMFDVEALDLITAAFIRQINLLTPEQIREGRIKSNLTQEALASALGVPDAAVARWEDGEQIQTRSLDNLLRLFFELPQVREILTTHQFSTFADTPAPK